VTNLLVAGPIWRSIADINYFLNLILIKYIFQKLKKEPNFLAGTENYNVLFGDKIFEEWQLEEWRKKRIFALKLSLIMKEVFIFSVFLVTLYLVSFSNLAYSAINYNKLFINTYVQQQNTNEIGLDQVSVNFFIYPKPSI
jgi:hypothetical protein